MIATHITTVNGATSVPLTDRKGPIADTLSGYLHRLDGAALFSIALWRLPDGVLLGQPEAHAASDENYLQSAGSADRLTVEVRITHGADSRQFAIGRNEPHDGTPATVTFGSHSLTVPANEVFTADEAAPIYTAYYETGAVPAGFALRELSI